MGCIKKLILLALILSLVLSSLDVKSQNSSNLNLLEINKDELISIISRFSNLGSRVTGYPGCSEAAQIIYEYFQDLGLKSKVQRYELLVPLDEGSFVEVQRGRGEVEKFTAYALWPNLIQPSYTPGGVEGTLIYVGKGRLEDFDGKEIRDAIVIMDFDSGDGWITALNLGAKAIIFVGSEGNRYQAKLKVSFVPIYAPRVYVKDPDGRRLVELAHEGARAKLFVGIRWETVEAENVIGILEGSQKPEEVVIVSTHYDSFSVVPAISPGADEASSLASLLLLAKYYSRNKPSRTLWFVSFSGHWQGLAGSREFVERFFFSPEVQEDKVKILTQVNLDFSSDGDTVSAHYVGHFYKYGSAGGGPEITSRYQWLKNIIKNIREEIFPKLGLAADSLTDVLSHFYWSNTQLEPYILDSEPAALSGCAAFSLVTSFARRVYWWTPFDTVEKVDLDTVARQTQVAKILIDVLTSDAEAPSWSTLKPSRIRLYARGGPASFITLRGKVVYFNFSKGWYEPLPNAIVRVGINPQSNFYLPANIFVKADSNGYFEVHGLPVATVLSYTTALFVEGWMISDESSIVYAPDLGIYGARAFSPYLSLWVHPENTTTVVFNCGTIELFDMLNPSYHRRTALPDPASSGDVLYLNEQAKLSPYSLREYAEPLFYGAYYNPREKVALVFMKPLVEFIVVLQRGVVKLSNVGIIANTSPSAPEGEGLRLTRPGDRVRVTFTALQFAKDVYRISLARYSVLSSHFVSSPSAPEVLANAESYIKLADEALKRNKYSEAYSYALLAWSWALVAYDTHVMPLIYDLTGTTVVFFSLLLPFALFAERLLFRQEGFKRLLTVVAIAALIFVGFSFSHPALALMSNSALSLAGIMVITFLLFALSILSSETSKIMDEEAVKRLGMHRFQRIRFSLVEVFSSVALENMRRYKLRTILTVVTVLTVTIALVSLTSSSNMLTASVSKLPYESTYDGILLKKGRSEPPSNVLDIFTAFAVRGVVGERGDVAPRVRLWPSMVYPTGMIAYVRGGGNSTIVRGVLGLTPIETKKLLSKALIEGRVFEEYDYYTCLLTSIQAKILGVEVGDEVDWYGLKLMVVGVLSTEILNQMTDLDGLPFTPLDPRTIPQYAVTQAQARIAFPLPYDEVLIVPASLALDLGGSVWSIAVYFRSNFTSEEAYALASQLAKAVDTPVYLGLNGAVTGVSKIVTWSLIGWETMFLLLAIGSLNVVMTFLAAIKERLKDLYVYSATGLPPRGAMSMFLAESFVYASLIIPPGYVAGIAFNYLLYILGVLPSTHVLNFSSLSITLTLLTLIAVIMASSLYPALKASGLITPSLERKWRLPTSPRGDEWYIPLPVTTPSSDEALGMLLYLKEYLEGEGRATMYFSVLSSPQFTGNSLRFSALLTPKELNITQEVEVRVENDKGRHTFSLYIKRLTGRYETWRTSNYYFVDSLRKQLLLWRSLEDISRKTYISKIKQFY